LKFLNVLLDLHELSLAALLFLLETVGVDVGVSDGLVLSVDDLPFLLESVDEFLSLFFWKDELLLIDLLLFFFMEILN
jgi:hypothetical protein